MSIITEQQLKKDIKEKKISGAYLFYGEESYLKGLNLERLTAAVLGGGDASFNKITVSWRDSSYEELFGNVENIPIGGERKCVILKDLDAEKLVTEDFKNLKGMIGDLPPYTVFVAYVDNIEVNLKKSAKWKKLLKLFEESGTVVEFPRMTPSALAKLLVDRALKYGVTLSKTDAQYLVSIVGNDLRRLLSELEKLCLSAGGGELTKKQMEQAIPQSLESSVFDLSKSIIKKDFDKAMQIVDNLLSRKEEPVAILAVLSGAYLDLYRARVILNCNGSRSDVAKAYRYFGTEFRLKNAERDSANMPMGTIRKCLDILTEGDWRLKSSPADRRIILEECIIRLGLATS